MCCVLRCCSRFLSFSFFYCCFCALRWSPSKCQIISDSCIITSDSFSSSCDSFQNIVIPFVEWPEFMARRTFNVNLYLIYIYETRTQQNSLFAASQIFISHISGNAVIHESWFLILFVFYIVLPFSCILV